MDHGLRKLISESSLTEQDLENLREMHEQAAVRLRERRCKTPYYRQMDEQYGMDFWRKLESGQGGLASKGI